MRQQRQLYREKIYRCGNYTEVDIYPVFGRQHGRGRKRKPTKAVQKALNEKNAKQKFIRLVNTNFTPKDIRIDLTYAPDKLPGSAEDAQKEVYKFIRRLKAFRKRAGLPELKYVYTTEVGEKTGRIHHHAVMSGGVDVADLALIWGKGYTTVKPLQFDPETGCSDLAAYMIKSRQLYKRWNASRNLKQPEETTRDGKLSRARAQEWSAQGMDCREAIEAWYGQKLADIAPFFNEVNRGVYITLRLYGKTRGKQNDQQTISTRRKRC